MAPENADSLDCAVCLEQLRDPSTLSCNHTFCRECILALPGVREAVESGEAAETACPLCRARVSTSVPRDVPVNPIMRDMLELLARMRAGASNAAAVAEIPAGEVVRGVEIGRGALGTVFAGTWGGRPVALKVIEAAALGAAGEREAAARRLRREAAILGTIRHPGVVQFYGVVREAGGGATLVTERADTSLRALLAERRLSLDECIDLGEQVLGALAHLHSRNIVHHDVKPGNILVFRGEGGRPQYKLADFGIAIAGAASTATAAVGTPAYAAPEALRGESWTDFAGDVYGAAVVLNEALAGRVPFAGMHPFQAMQRVIGGQRPELAMEGVPAAVQALVQRMWAGDAAARPSAEEACRALVAARSPPADPAAAVRAIPASSAPIAPQPAAAPPAELLVAAGASIMDAVRRAAPGQPIRLAPGRYREAVVLEKEVHIVGPREAVLEWGEGVTLHCKGPTAPSVRGITIRNRAPEESAVRITGGSRAVIEGCDVSSSGLSGIEALGEGTAPALRSNVVHFCGRAGIFFHTSAKGTAEANDVFGNARAGIAIETGADPVVRGNKVHDGMQGGIFVYENGRGTVEANDVFGNALAGIQIKTGADPVVRGNKVHDGKQGGIFVYANGRGTVEANDVFGNALPGIEIKTGADPVVRGNKVHDQQHGIYVREGGKGTVSGNTLERISGQALSVAADCPGSRAEGNTIR